MPMPERGRPRNRDQATVVDQSHARHILIKVSEATS